VVSARTEINYLKTQIAVILATINSLKASGTGRRGSTGASTTSGSGAISSTVTTMIINTTTTEPVSTTIVLVSAIVSNASSIQITTTSIYTTPLSSNPALDTFLINQSVIQNKSIQYFVKMNDTLANLAVSKNNI
jgi:hypothetical protein